VSAPGEGLISYFPTSAYAHWSGTSFSSGLVSGEAALLISARPGARFNDVVDAIERSAKPIDNLNPSFRGRLGSGRIDVLAAVRLIRG
jgi:subtilisin family serine protease